MKKVLCIIIAVVMALVVTLSLSGCSSHECSVCGETENVHKNKVTVEDLGEGMADDETVAKLKEEWPYICDDCFDRMVELYKKNFADKVREALGY